MFNFKILKTGTSEVLNTEGEYIVDSATILFTIDEYKILIDPGSNCDLLISCLQKVGLAVDDVDYVYITHFHPDHTIASKLFDAPIVHGLSLYDANHIYTKHAFFELFSKHVDIIYTPGHMVDHNSLLFEFKKHKICYSADVFFWYDNHFDLNEEVSHNDLLDLSDPVVWNKEELLQSRRALLNLDLDYIIPGHGEIYDVKNGGLVTLDGFADLLN